MNIDVAFKKFRQTLTRIFERFHVIIFSIIIAGGLAALVLALSQVLRVSGEENGYVSPSSSAAFDQITIDKIEQLRTRNTSGTISLPRGRINPFVE